MRHKRLGEVAVVTMGQSPPGDSCNRDGSGDPLLNGPTEFGASHPTAAQWTTDPKRWAERGDVLFCVRGSTTGRMNQADQRYAIGRGLAAIRGRDEQDDSRLFRYLIEFRLRDLLALTTGSTFPNLSRSDLEGLQVPWPDVPTRNAIAGLLGALDDKIDLNQRIIEHLDSAIELEFRATVSGHGSEHFSQVLEVQMGSAFKGDKFAAPRSGRPLLRIRDLKTFTSDIWTTEQRPDESVIHPGDVVVGMDAEFRSVLWRGLPSVLNQRVCTFKPVNGACRAFALHAIRSDLRFYEQAKTGTTVIHLNKADIERFAVPQLDAEAHASLAAATDPLVDRLLAASRETRTLVELRDALLPKLLSGELRVREAEEAVEGVA